MPELFVDAEEIAKLLHLSRPWVYTLARREDNPLPSHMLGVRTRRFRISEVEAWLEAGRRRAEDEEAS